MCYQGHDTSITSLRSFTAVTYNFVILTSLLCVMSLVSTVCSFNVDTSKPKIYKGPNGSYFGYSVAMLENKKGRWILVGAPKAEDGSVGNGTVKQPGALFQCNWQYPSSCKPIVIDTTGNEKQVIPKNKNITVQNNKDFQWLGAAVDVNYHGNKNVVVCAPRWKESQYEVQGLIFMNGMCYESSEDLDFNTSSPWPALDNHRLQIHQTGYHGYGMASMGTAAHYAKDGSFLVFGAPGLNDWTGGYVHIAGNLQSRPKVVESPPEELHNSYIGYAITTAQLTADATYIIVGGPRQGNNGKAIGYNTKDFKIVFKKDGEQFGSYFGASVCGADLNRDQLDDVLVGAPMFMDKYDEGRVYVYINREFFNMELLLVLNGSNTPGARFGTTITNLDDINNDHFHDIAVGAPYEAVTGVVYIYNGAKTGLHAQYSQRIVGSSVDPGLRAFGYAISRPFDIDENYFSDIVVGAYGSDKAVLLKTRSVLDLQARLNITPSAVSPLGSTCLYKLKKIPCVEARTCIRYTGINLPPAAGKANTYVWYTEMNLSSATAFSDLAGLCLTPSIWYTDMNLSPAAEVTVTLRVDTLERHRGELPRLFMTAVTGDQELQEKSTILELRQDVWNCDKTIIYVKESRDLITPLQLEVDYDVSPDKPGISLDCDICPIRNFYSRTHEIRQIGYIRLCGPDNRCTADLHVEARPVFAINTLQSELLIDDSAMFDVEVTVSNKGEQAYMTYVTLRFPDSVKFIRALLLNENLGVTCLPPTTINNTAVVECDLMSPVMEGVEVVLRARFWAASLPFSLRSFNVEVEARTASEEAAPSQADNLVNVTIPVRLLSSITLHRDGCNLFEEVAWQAGGNIGTPGVLGMRCSAQSFLFNTGFVNFTWFCRGIYTCKIGVAIPGQIEMARPLLSDATVNLTHRYTLYNRGPSPLPNGQLNITLPHTNLVWLSNINAHSPGWSDKVELDCVVIEGSSRPSRQERGPPATPTAIHNHTQHQPMSDITSLLMCRPGNCTLVRCNVGLLLKGQSLMFSLNITVKRNILQTMKVVQQLHIKSQASFLMPLISALDLQTTIKQANATTFLVYKQQHRLMFAWWVVGVSMASGCLVLYIMVVLLCKCGFFRRKRREELQMLVDSSFQGDEQEPMTAASSPTTTHSPSEMLQCFPSTDDSQDVMVLPPTNSFFPSTDNSQDVMVLPPTNSFFPDPAQRTLHLRNNNIHLQADNDFSHVHQRSCTLGYSGRQRSGGGERGVNGGLGLAGGSLGRRGHNHSHWTPLPPPPLPAFNNKLYLEPLEHTV